MKFYNYAQFEKYAEEHGLDKRVWSRGEWEAQNQKKNKPNALADAPPTKEIEHANTEMFKKYCAQDGTDPAKAVASPLLRKIISDQNEARTAIDDSGGP